MANSNIDQIKENETSFNNEVDLMDIFWVLWNKKIFISGLTSFIAALAIIYALSLTNYYRSESLLIGVNSQGSSSLSQYSGLASLAGISLPSSGTDPVIEVMEIVQSREFVRHLITFEGILPAIMAAKSYNYATKEIVFDSEAYDKDTGSWLREANANRASKPSYLEAYEKYLGMVSISQDIKTGLVSISVEHVSPVFSKYFLNLIIKEANNLKRANDIEMSDKALSYLKQEVSRTSLTEIKESIYRLMEAQLEKKMMANINEQYSLMILEPPFVPEERFKPSRSLIVIILTAIGGVISCFIVLIRHYFFKKK